MALHEDGAGRLDPAAYETRADQTQFMANEGGEEDARHVARESVDDVLELCEEVRRLQGVENRLCDLMAMKRDRINKDRQIAREQGDSWLGINTHTISANLLDRELQNLERVHHGIQ